MTQAPYTPTTPENAQPGMFGPGQAERLASFLKEQGVEPGLVEDEGEGEGEGGEGEGLILGKFKSPEDLAKAYKELERKLGQPKEEPGEAEAEEKPAPVDPATYTKELGAERYGEAMADLFEQAQFNPLEVEAKIEAGELELSDAAEQMAEVLPFSKAVIEAYLNGVYEVVDPGQDAGQPQQLTPEQEQEIRDAVGGDKAFSTITTWAKANLPEADLEAYNEAVNSGNPRMALLAARFLQSAAAAAQAVPIQEPKLVGRGAAPSAGVTRFESKEQALEAMNRLNSRGQRMYDVDPAYRQKIAEIVARSELDW